MAESTYVGLEVILARVMTAAEEGVRLAADDLVEESKAASPVATGALRDGIHVAHVAVAARSVIATVSTSGVDYAVYQHEGTSRGVPATKFIERPLLANTDTYVGFIAASMRAAL